MVQDPISEKARLDEAARTFLMRYFWYSKEVLDQMTPEMRIQLAKGFDTYLPYGVET